MAKKNKEPREGTIAFTADRHKYYEKAVQCVESEIDMVDETYTTLRGAPVIAQRPTHDGMVALFGNLQVVTANALVTECAPVGTVFMPFHYHEAPANNLTNDALDPR